MSSPSQANCHSDSRQSRLPICSHVFFAEDDVFAYLLNGIVDGSLVFVSLLLWSLAGRVGSPAAPP